MSKATLARETFQTSRLLEYFSEKELRLQTGHHRAHWPAVVLKELVDNSLDAAEEVGVRPQIDVTITDDTIVVQDNGPGISAAVVHGILNFDVRTSSKDSYLSPARGSQGNALKTVLAIPFVLSDGHPEPIVIESQGLRHTIAVALDRIAQEPHIQLATEPLAPPRRQATSVPGLRVATGATVQKGTCVAVRLGKRTPVDPAQFVSLTSACWYTAEQFTALVAAYVHAERAGRPAKFVRDFVAEFRGLARTGTRKQILDGWGPAGQRLHDLVVDLDVEGGLPACRLSARDERRAERRAR